MITNSSHPSLPSRPSRPAARPSRPAALPSRPAARQLGVVFVFAACAALAAFLPAPRAFAQKRAEPDRPCPDKPALGLPDWARTAIIYEVNIRQFSESGKLNGVTDDLPRLRKLGVNVIWLMPVHPIGKIHRMGALGSPYSVQDYRAINPELGTAEDFRKLVDAAHAQGFRVLMDWVGNHSAWDNALTKTHPDFYVRNAQGNFTPPAGTNWRGSIQFNFKNRAVWDYEADTMAFWMRDYGVDGFRCDFASGLPTAAWDYITAKLRALRPDLFMLAESDQPQHQLKAFNASYTFPMMRAINNVAKGAAPLSRIDDTLASTRKTFPKGATMMYYTSNHDTNSMNGSEYERLGAGAPAFAVLTFMFDGIPLIYTGQEAGIRRRIKFIERDPIQWRDHPMFAFYQTLCELRKTNPALRTGAPMRRLATTADNSLYVVLREAADKSGRRVLALLNLTARDVKGAKVSAPALAGAWTDVFGAGNKSGNENGSENGNENGSENGNGNGSGNGNKNGNENKKTIFKATQTFDLKAWEYRVFVSA